MSVTNPSQITAVAGEDVLQNVIDNLVTDNGGGIIFLQKATYLLDQDLIIPSDVKLIGVGSGGSIINFQNQAFQIKIVGDAMNHVVSPYLEGITVKNSSISLIKLDYVDNFAGKDIETINGLIGFEALNLEILNFEIFSSVSCPTGISISNCDGMTLNNMAVEGFAVNGFIFDTINNATFINSSAVDGTGAGIQMINCSDFTLDSYSLVNIVGVGMILDGVSVMSASSGTLEDCTEDGLKIQNITKNCQFVTSNFNDNGGWGVNIVGSDCEDNLFSTNDFSGNTSGAMDDNGTGTLIKVNIGLADN